MTYKKGKALLLLTPNFLLPFWENLLKKGAFLKLKPVATLVK